MGETMEKESRSVRRTKKALHDSLVELLKTRSILRIGVKEICDGADVGRSTFYAHYDDQYDLLREMEDEAFDGFEALRREQIEVITKRPGAQDFKRLVEGMLDYIVKNGASIQVLLSENGDQNFSKRFFRVSTDRLHDFHKRTSAQAAGDEKIAHYHAVFVTGGFITLIQEWLKSGMDTPVPEMANLLANLTRAALE